MMEYLIEHMEKQLGLRPYFAIEIEFTANSEEDVVKSVNQLLHDHKFNHFSITKESKLGHYEIKTAPTGDIVALAKNVEKVRSLILSQIKNSSFDGFCSKFDVTNGMHVNIHLANSDYHNYFIHNRDIMVHSIGGMLLFIEESMVYFAPYENDYIRFSGKIDAPSNISWGGNNRTTAIRIPDSYMPRIEHRVPCASCDIYNSMLFILVAITYGIKNYILPNKRVYGNAFDEQYKIAPYSLKSLPRNLFEAQVVATQTSIIKDYIKNFL